MTKKECTLEAEVLVDLYHDSTPFDIFQTVTGMNELLEIIVTETNRYATQKVCNFETTEGEMKAFLGINFIMGINKLPSLEDYWLIDKYIGNEKIQNVEKGEKGIEFRFKCGTRFMPSPERYLLSRVF